MAVPRGAEKQEKYDFILQDIESTTPVTFLGLMLAKDPETKRKLVKERRVPPFGQRVSSGQLGPGDRDPLTKLTWAQYDWSEGALIESTNISNRGYMSGSIDAAYPNVLSQGIGKNYGSHRGNTDFPIGFLLIDPHFEASAANTPWTNDAGGNGTLTFGDTTGPRTVLLGTKALKAVMTATGAICSQALANPTVYRSREITVAVYVKRTAGSGGIRVNIVDSAGTTNGNTVTASGYTVSTATRTIDAGATSVTIQIECVTASGTFFADDASVYSGTNLTPARSWTAVLSDAVYMAAGRFICKLRTGTANTYVWDAVYVHASATATDIIAYENNASAKDVYVAFGKSAAFVYGSDTTWTASTLAGTTDENKAVYFTINRNLLWKSEDENTLKWSVNPRNGGSFSAGYQIGRDDAEITGLHPVGDTILVGKEDGAWRYRWTYNDGTSADVFQNVTKEFQTLLSLDHFRLGAEYDGWTYLTLGAGAGFCRTNNDSYQSLSDVFSRPAAGQKGIVRALATDPHQLWCFADDKVFSYKRTADGVRIHTRAPSPTVTAAAQSYLTTQVASNTGATSPGTGENSAVGSFQDWATPSNVTASDDSRATCTVYPTSSPVQLQFSDYLVMRNFGFAIPSTATIVGIAVSIERHASAASTVHDSSVTLWNSGAIGSDYNDAATYWPTSDAAKAYGGATDLWGYALTPAIINGANFGVAIQVHNNHAADGSIARVDHATITVYYTTPSTQETTIQIKAASVVPWSISSIYTPHLLCVMAGLESTDNVPYHVTDCYALPRTAATPNLDQASLPHSPATDILRTSRYDGGAPTEPKIGISFALHLVDPATDQPVAVKFGVNGGDPSTTTLATFSGSGAIQRAYWEDLAGLPDVAEFYSIQFQFEATYSGSTNKRRIRGFELEMIPAIQVLRTWEVAVQVGGATYNDGVSQNQDLNLSKDQIIANLTTLEARGYPYKLVEDFDMDGTVTVYSVKIRPGTLVRDFSLERGPNTGEVWRFQLDQIRTSD